MGLLIKDYDTLSGRKIVVIDNVISQDITSTLFEYYNNYALWTGYSYQEGEHDNVPFISGIDSGKMQTSLLWKKLAKCIKKFWGDEEYIPYDCSVNNTRYGDAPTQHRDIYTPDKKSITLLIYLNPVWNIDFSGETVYFNDRDEIEFSVIPKFGRIVMHDGYIKHCSRAPSKLFNGNRYTLAIKASPNLGKIFDAVLTEDEKKLMSSTKKHIKEIGLG